MFASDSILSCAVMLPGDQAFIFGIIPVSEAGIRWQFSNPCNVFGPSKVIACVCANQAGPEKSFVQLSFSYASFRFVK